MIAMGLVIVLVDAFFGGWDGVPDPLGWLLVLAGVLALRDHLDVRGLVAAAVTSLLVALATYPPAVGARLDDNTGWVASLPALAFAFVLCTALAEQDEPLAGRFRVVRWLVVALAAGPVIVLGAGVDVLREPLGTLSVATQAYLIFLVFAASRRVPVAPSDDAGPPPVGSGPA